ncbi:MAG: SGNH/GDSL hydrolase family protein [Acidimicrobiia bacterium]|nr:SGNH/GDSL hydrolase family protein [Acidimicrobiia bacterium]
MSATVSGPLRAAIIVFGVLAGVAGGALALFTIGESFAVLTAATIAIAATTIAFTAPVFLGRAVLAILILAFAGTVLTGAYGAVQVLAALAGSQSGPVDPPDQETLEAAERKIDQSVEDTTFQVTLTEAELNAVLLDSLSETETPFQRITIDIVNAVGEPALIGFVGDFKNGRLSVEGELTARVRAGQVEAELLSADVGMFTMPGFARDAVEDMIGRVADLNRALAEEGADVQEVVIGDDSISVTGVASGSSEINAEVMLAAFGDLGGLAATNLNVTPYESGVESATAEGSPVYIALGDSLAAAVGVDGYAEGYVSQVHRELSIRDGSVYGLRNFGVSGETTGTMLVGGQLDAALDFGSTREVAYVTIDIGANDLLGHLASSDCAEDVQAAPCAVRIEASLNAYQENIDEIFASLRDAFPNATVVFLQAYNPFSLGFEDQVAFEAQSNMALQELNAIGATAAERHGLVVADGFSPMQGTTTATTHMTSIPPDIHPNATGYDILTEAIMSALG